MLSCERSESADDDDDDDAGQGICHVPVLTTLVSTLTASADIDILITAPLVVLLIMSRASGGKVSSGKDIDCPSNVNADLFCSVHNGPAGHAFSPRYSGHCYPMSRNI